MTNEEKTADMSLDAGFSCITVQSFDLVSFAQAHPITSQARSYSNRCNSILMAQEKGIQKVAAITDSFETHNRLNNLLFLANSRIPRL